MTYYQVVFTLPGALSELALANREAMADLLFESAAACLRKTIRTQQDYDPASMMVLHTWNQQLHPHWHVHALVPGGGPISDRRIIAADADHVTLLAREGKQVGGERSQVPVTLKTAEFVRRWCDHIQPDQLTKTRYFGGWCCRKRTEYQARCIRLLGMSGEREVIESDGLTSSGATLGGEAVAMESSLKCQGCESHRLRLIARTAKPSWASVLTHFDHGVHHGTRRRSERGSVNL